ncbi:hypothetical protein [Psittacicella melopsittaci]|nr:hypothetical protein [Psittacicella melopsittaci]
MKRSRVLTMRSFIVKRERRRRITRFMQENFAPIIDAKVELTEG